MPSHKIPLSEHIFKISVKFSKVSSSNSLISDAIIDTGASVTCVGFSVVQKLGISPSGPFSITQTASGPGFSRPYPIEILIDNKIHKVSSCSVLFRPVLFVTQQSQTKYLNEAALRAISQQNGLPFPEAILQSSTLNQDNTYTVKAFQPGAGVEQPVALIGMNCMAQLDWHFGKKAQELDISY